MNEASDAISRAQEQMQALNDSYRQTELDLITAENEKKAVESAISDFGSRQERWDRELKSIEEQKASSDSMKQSLIDEAEEAGRKAELAEAKVSSLSDIYETEKQEAQAASEDITEARVAVTACEKELQASGAIYQRISDDIDEISGSIEAKKLQLENLEAEYKTITASSENGGDIEARNKEKQEAEADAMPSQNPKIYLTDYLVKVPVGTSVDLLSYVSEIKDDSDDIYALWRKVQITGEVNSAVPGTYKCTYYVIDSQNNISNNAVLTVIVE